MTSGSWRALLGALPLVCAGLAAGVPLGLVAFQATHDERHQKALVVADAFKPLGAAGKQGKLVRPHAIPNVSPYSTSVSAIELASVEPVAAKFALQGRPAPARRARTELVAFQNAPFPYDGRVPAGNARFLNVDENGRLGHRTYRGRIYWADETYSDRRALLHIPGSFDIRKPGFLIVFFHGHGATLARDVRDRQRVPEQISASRANAVLVAPQLAVDAADSSAGNLWRPGALERFLDEAASRLAQLYGDPRAERVFAAMPVVIVAYSGGYVPAAWSVYQGGLRHRLRGVVLLDGLYGDLDKFTDWIGRNRQAFFVSAYTNSTKRHNAELEHILTGRGIAFDTAMKPQLRPGSVTFLAALDVGHRDFVTHAWTEHPIEDLLRRLTTYPLAQPKTIATLARF